MKKPLALNLALLCASFLSGTPAAKSSCVAGHKAKPVKKTVLQPHPQSNQDSIDATGKHGDQDILIRAWDGLLFVWKPH